MYIDDPRYLLVHRQEHSDDFNVALGAGGEERGYAADVGAHGVGAEVEEVAGHVVVAVGAGEGEGSYLVGRTVVYLGAGFQKNVDDSVCRNNVRGRG